MKRRRAHGMAILAAFAALLTASAVAAAQSSSQSGLIGCIETTGNADTIRDLKLRPGPCHPGEQPIAWPPSGSTGPTGHTGPAGPAGPPGP